MVQAGGADLEVSEADVLLGKRIIGAASRHDLSALRILLREGSASVRDPTSGTTPLHAAVYTCIKADGTADAEAEAAAAPVMQLLLQNGAIWNDLDKSNETPGCVALRLGLDNLYAIMVDAGVRAELLFGQMEKLGLDGTTLDDDDDDEEDALDADEGAKTNPETSKGTEDRPEKRARVDQETIVSEAVETSIAEIRDAQGELPPLPENEDLIFNNHAYLASELRFRPGILLDASDNAVMMDWENTIMQRHAETLLPTPGLRALNIGHGLGLVDTAIQLRQPKEHHIIEAHPQVIARMKEQGWDKKPGVRIWEGRWQDMLPRMVAEGVILDAIYYDTFAENYSALKDLFSEWVIQVMDSDGKFGWYNGLGADRQICYDVYTKVAEMDLYEAGFDTVWEDIAVPSDLHGSKQWEGTRRPYWKLDVYRLPINTFIK